MMKLKLQYFGNLILIIAQQEKWKKLLISESNSAALDPICTSN